MPPPGAARECSPILPARLASARAAAAAAAAAVIAAAAAKASRARRLRPCFIDGQRTATELLFMQLVDRGLRVRFRRHFDEREAACTARRHVAHHAYGLDRPGLTEQLFEIGFRCFIRDVADIQFAIHLYSVSSRKLVLQRSSPWLTDTQEGARP